MSSIFTKIIWRLCNACGLHYQAMMRNEKKIPVVECPRTLSIEELLNPEPEEDSKQEKNSEPSDASGDVS